MNLKDYLRKIELQHEFLSIHLYVLSFLLELIIPFISVDFLTRVRMLGEKGVKAFGIVLNRACSFKFIPFDWDSKTQTLQVAGSNGFHYAFLISSLNWLHFVHLLFSYIFLKSQMSPTRQALHLIWLVTSGLGVVFSINHFIVRNELVAFSNRFFRLHYFLRGKVLIVKIQFIFYCTLLHCFSGKLEKLRRDSKELNICEILLQSLVYVPYIQSFFGSLIFLYDYKSERYLYSFIYSTTYHSIPLLIVFWVLEFFFYFTLWHLCLLSTEYIILYWHGGSGWLKELRYA